VSTLDLCRGSFMCSRMSHCVQYYAVVSGALNVLLLLTGLLWLAASLLLKKVVSAPGFLVSNWSVA
jgi:hypothetical protein